MNKRFEAFLRAQYADEIAIMMEIAPDYLAITRQPLRQHHLLEKLQRRATKVEHKSDRAKAFPLHRRAEFSRVTLARSVEGRGRRCVGMIVHTDPGTATRSSSPSRPTPSLASVICGRAPAV